MKSVMGKVKQTLSILLAVAMVVTCVPQTGLNALAAEQAPEAVEETAAGSDAAQTVADESLADDDSSVDKQSEEAPSDEDSNTEEKEEGGDTEDAQDPTDETAAPADDEADASSDETDVPAEETQAPADGTEAPAEDSETEGKADLMEDPAPVTNRTVTINNYATVKRQVAIDVTVDEESLKITADGKITVPDGKTVKFDLTATKKGWKIKEVKNGDTPITGIDAVYTISKVEADITVTITTAEVYNLSVVKGTALTDSAAKIKLDASLKDALEGDGDAKLMIAANAADPTVVEKGSEAKDLKFSVQAETGDGKKLRVSYKADNSVEAVPVDGVDEGTGADKVTYYTIDKAVIANLDEIEITLDAEAQCNVSYTAANYAGKVDLKVVVPKTGAGATGTEEVAYDADTNGKVWKGETFTFKAAAKAPWKITAVKAGAKTLEAKDGEYSFEVEQDVELTFETELDAAECYSVSFALTGDKGSATAEITQIVRAKQGGEESDVTLNGASNIKAFLNITDEAEKVLIKAGDENAISVPKTAKFVTVAVTAADGYKLEKLAGSTEEADNVASRTIIFGSEDTPIPADGKMAVSAKTVANVSESDTFFTAAATETVKNITVAVTAEAADSTSETAKIFKVDGKENIYKVKSGTDKVSFKITAKEGWTSDQLAALESNAAVASVEEEPGTDNATVYTVTLLAAELGANAENATNLTITDEKFFTFAATIEDEDTSAYGTEFSITPGEKWTDEENVLTASAIPYGAKLEYTITAKTNFKLSEVTYKMGGTTEKADIEEKAGRDTAVITIDKVTDDVVITVASDAEYTLMPLRNDDSEEVEVDSDGVYQVDYKGAYYVGVYSGGVPVPVSDVTAKVTKGGTEVTMSRVTTAGNMLRIDLSKKSDLAGSEIRIEMSVKGKAIGSYLLKVSKATTSITINDGEDIAQVVGTRVSYPLATEGEALVEDETATIALGVNSSDFIQSATIVDGELVIVTKAVDATSDALKDKKATITITSTDDTDVEATVTVTPIAVFEKDMTPDANIVAAGDTILNYKLSSSIADDLETGKVSLSGSSLWYKVTATAVTSTDSPLATGMKSTVTEYIKRTGASDKAELQVGTSPNLGEGNEQEYNVSVTLVYVNGRSTTPTAATTPIQSSAAKEDNVETKKPTFAATLKLTKKNTTFYTGQSTFGVDKNGNSKNIVAKAEFKDKFNPSYKIVSAEIKDSVSDYGGLDSYLDVDADGNIVISGVSEYATTGKHTLTVTAIADQNGSGNAMGASHTMYAARATVVVTIVQGINDLAIDTPSTSIYKKPDNRTKATLKLTPVYNYGVKEYTPKTKKVTWEIVGANSDAESGIEKAPAYLTTDAGKTGSVTIKNGTITVAGNYVVDPDHPSWNRFRVLVRAADFSDNEIIGLTETITITHSPADVSTLVIAKNIGGEYVVMAEPVAATKGKSNITISAADAQDAYTIAAPAAAASKVKKGDKFVSLDALKAKVGAVDGDIARMTSTNVKVLGWRYGELNILAAGKKAGIKITANDGSKAVNTATLTLGYTDTSKDEAAKDLALKIGYYTGDDAFEDILENKFDPSDPGKTGDISAANKSNVKESPANVKFSKTGAARLKVALLVGDDAGDDKGGKSKRYSADDAMFANYKLTVKGGKTVSNSKGEATIIMTSATTTLTLTDLSAQAKKAKKTAYVYNVTNEAAALAKKAPTVKVEKSSLHESAKKDEQFVELTLTDAATKEKVAKNTKVRVEVDWSARTTSNGYDEFNGLLDSGEPKDQHVFTVGDNGYLKLTFNEEYSCGNIITMPSMYSNGKYKLLTSYKLKVTEGTLSGDGKFTAAGLPATTTVKVTPNKKFTFKPATSYTFNKVDGSVMLTGTGKASVNAKAGDSVVTDFYKLENAQSKSRPGESNNFTHYFKVRTDTVGDKVVQKLVLNTDDPLVEKLYYNTKDDGTLDKTKPIANAPDLTRIAAEDLTGYIWYRASAKEAYYDGDIDAAVKVTIKIAAETAEGKAAKASQKYAADSAEAALTKDATTEVNVFVNGAYVPVAYVMIDPSKAKSNAPALDLISKEGNGKGQIQLKMTDKEETDGKSLSTNLLIMPEDSLYAERVKAGEWDKAAAAPTEDAGTPPTAPAKESRDTLMKQYGISIKISVTRKTNPKRTKDPTEVTTTPPSTGMTIAQAKAAVEGWVNLVENVAEKPVWLTADTVSGTSVSNAAASALTTVTAAGFSIEINGGETTDFTFTPAKLKTDGSVSGKLKVSKGGDAEVVTFTFTVPKKGDAVKAAIETALADEKVKINSSSALVDGEENRIKGEVETAVENAYTVAVKDGAGLTVSSGNNQATVTFTITDTNDATDSIEVPLTLATETQEE